MIGNSLRSDILPILELGGWAMHLAGHPTWSHEDDPTNHLDQERYLEVEGISKVLETLDETDLLSKKKTKMIYFLAWILFTIVLLGLTLARSHPYRFQRFLAFESILSLIFINAKAGSSILFRPGRFFPGSA